MTGQTADWTEGDWKGDGLFDQLDSVAALQTGNYLSISQIVTAVDAVFARLSLRPIERRFKNYTKLVRNIDKGDSAHEIRRRR